MIIFYSEAKKNAERRELEQTAVSGCIFEKMAAAIPLAFDGGLRQPKVVVYAILESWENGNLKTDINTCCSTA